LIKKSEKIRPKGGLSRRRPIVVEKESMSRLF